MVNLGGCIIANPKSWDLSFVLEAGTHGLKLPSFYGSTFRGAFGMEFKRINNITTYESLGRLVRA